MGAVLAITGDWFRLIIDQKAFRILIGLCLLAGLALAGIKIGEDSLELLFVWQLPLGGESVFAANGARPGDVFLFFLLSFYLTSIPFFGYLIGLFATGGVVPDMLRRGRIDAILARPIGRFQVVAGSYLGGLLFVLLLSTLLVGSSWVGFAVRGRPLSPVYFLSILVMLSQYALVYALAVFFGFWLRSTAAAILLTLGSWLLGKIFVLIHGLKAAVEGGGLEQDVPWAAEMMRGPTGVLVDSIYTFVPKVSELDHLSNAIFARVIGEDLVRIMARGSGAEKLVVPPDWWLVGISSLGLALALLAGATFVLHRRDL